MALYHKYRPQTFSDVIDQEHIIKTLINQITTDKVSHAYLFTGPRGVGKTTTARILAKSLNCKDKKEFTAEPCNNCQSCQEITNSTSIDVIEIDAASHTGVDNVRQNIIENSQFKPTTSKLKIFIIDEVHMLSTAAFNALLKTLEEPPNYVVFILATTDPQKLPATIISRCQRYTFSKVPSKEMSQSLKNIAEKEGVKIEENVLLRVARKSEGCLRDGISLLEQLMASGAKKITEEIASLVLPSASIELQLEFAKYLANKQQKEALNFLNKLDNEGLNIIYFSHDFIEFLRVLMIAGVDMDLAEHELDLNKENKEKIQELKTLLSEIEIIKLLDLAIKRDGEVKNSVLPQLPLEMLAIEWCNQDNKTTTKDESLVQVKNENKQVEPKKIELVVENTIQQTETIEPKKEENIEITTETAPETKKEITEPVLNTPANNAPVSKEQVENNWSNIIKALEIEAPSMTFILKMAKIQNVQNNVITLSVEYSFHKEKLSENVTKQKIENIFNTILGSQIRIEITEITGEKKIEANNNQLNNLATALGGQILN